MRKNTTPTLVARASRCMHAWYLECHGDPDLKVEPDAGTRLLWERGNEHERRMVAMLPGYVEPEWDHPDWEAGFQATLQLMREGAEWIYQGVLIRDDMYGKPDLLQRIERPSILGGHSYRPVDVKGHKDVLKKDRMQLASYAWMLEPVLGYRPDEGAIWLNTGEMASVPLDGPGAELDELRRAMGEVREGQAESIGFRCTECGLCPWSEYCQGEWEKRQCVCLVCGVTADKARKLSRAGIHTVSQVFDLGESGLMDKLGCNENAASKIHIHAKARVLGKPIVKKPFPLSEGRPVIFYDIETYGEVVYLHGLVRLEGGSREERSFLARHPEDEEKVWHAFLDYLADHEGAVVYTWSTYERGPADRLWGKYGGNEKGWRVLDSGMVDMCRLVKDHVALPVATYGIKEVAPVFGFHWHADDAGGLNSEAWYGEWLRDGDEGVLHKIVEYNLDDVRGMEMVFEALSSKATEEGVR